MDESFLASLVRCHIDERLVGLPCACFRRDIRPKISYDVAAFVDVMRTPKRAVAIQKMRPHATHGKKSTIGAWVWFESSCVGLDHLSNHLQMAELFNGDVL